MYWYNIGNRIEVILSYHSQALSVQAHIIHNDIMNTTITVPGKIFIRVLSTNLVLNVILLRAPMLREEASVNSLLCRSITRIMRYSLRNMGRENITSSGTSATIQFRVLMSSIAHLNVYDPGNGCIAHMTSSTMIWEILRHDIVIRQSSIQLSTTKSCNRWDHS